MKSLIENKNVESVLKRVKVNVGDMIYIPAGTVHAIEGGIKLLEVQQCSDVTYRIYDWGRDREVHIEKSLDVINFSGGNGEGVLQNFKILKTKYFTVEKIFINGKNNFECSGDYNIYYCLNGGGEICNEENEKLNIEKGDSIYVMNGTKYSIAGNLEMLSIN